MLSTTFHREGNFQRGFRCPLFNFKIVECEMQVRVTSGSRKCINQTLEEKHKWHLQRAGIKIQP